MEPLEANAKTDKDYSAKKLAIIVISVKLVVLLFGYIFAHSYLHNNQAFQHSLASIINNWDASHYLTIAQNGYESIGEHKVLIVFFPLFPIALYLTKLVVLNWTAASFLVTTLFSFLAAFALYKLVRLDYPAKIAKRAVWFMLLFPTAYFFHIGYTEGLFLALALGSFYYARKHLWLYAGLLALLASLTRINGLLLFLPLSVEIFQEWRQKRRFIYRWLYALLPVLGFGLYLLLNWIVSGSATAFLLYQKVWWYHQIIVPWTAIYGLGKSALQQPFTQQNFILLWSEFIAVISSAVLVVVSYFKLRPSYAVWLLANLILWASNSFILSTPRYLLIAFPVFILLARLAKNKYLYWLLLIISTALMLFYWSRFVVGYWAF